MDIPAAEPGNIVGYEIAQDVRPYILQEEWYFQETLPVADARYTLQLPPGWEYKAVWVNHPELTPSSIGNNQWQWKLSNIPEIKREEYMPAWRSVAGLMIFGNPLPGGANHGFLNWSRMGSWYIGLLQDRRDATPEIKQKVAELTSTSQDPLIKDAGSCRVHAKGYPLCRDRTWNRRMATTRRRKCFRAQIWRLQR